jgi:glucose-6-phosphate 1-dehydrogenase
VAFCGIVWSTRKLKKNQLVNDSGISAPCAFVIFGATGDLTKRLLLPALYNLAAGGLLPLGFSIIGVARGDLTDGQFQDHLADAVRTFATGPIDPHKSNSLLASVRFVRGDFTDQSTYRRLQEALRRVENVHDSANRLFYLATPPDDFAEIVQRLAQEGLTRPTATSWRRVIVEKPFGTSLPSACNLNEQLLRVLREDQLYRIDHFLGKETMQNVMVLRFANGLFEPIWNRHHVDHVQITVAETLTVEQRGGYYDHAGALRDMVPNHLFQVLSLIAMEPPASFSADAVRTERTKVLESLHPISRDAVTQHVVRGQYRAGNVQGRSVPDYRREAKVDPSSTTETFVAMRLAIENWRWAGVPFYLRTGKALSSRCSEIAIKFRQAPFTLFRETPVERLPENFLVISMQPEEGISIRFNAKIPGQDLEIQGVRMRFRYEDYFKATCHTGYETLIYDCLIGDQTLFLRADNAEASWRVVQPILDAWDMQGANDLAAYAAGSSGPKEADLLIERDGRHWRRLEPDDQGLK